jgi:hypothetical protein
MKLVKEWPPKTQFVHIPGYIGKKSIVTGRQILLTPKAHEVVEWIIGVRELPFHRNVVYYSEHPPSFFLRLGYIIYNFLKGQN